VGSVAAHAVWLSLCLRARGSTNMKKLLSLSLTGIMLFVSAETVCASWNGPPMGMHLMPVPP
jgi:hypothetical protein